MTRLLTILLIAAILALSSCVMSGKNAASKTPATPAPPVATAAAKPPAPPPPLSTPQTDIHLPPPQSVSDAALATIPLARVELPAPEPDEPTAKPPAKSKQPAAVTATKPESPAPPAETPSPVQGPTAPTTTPAEQQQPLLQPVFPEEERRRIWGTLEKRKADIEAQLGKNENRMSPEQKSVAARIHSFLDQAEDMAKRGDFRSAEGLSDRAAILAKELAGAR